MLPVITFPPLEASVKAALFPTQMLDGATTPAVGMLEILMGNIKANDSSQGFVFVIEKENILL